MAEEGAFTNINPCPDIRRLVTRHDMCKLFMQFMAQIQLGKVATQYEMLADQHQSGTLHDDCVKLAELHSTAVDCSKLGISLPHICRRNGGYRPDFMAPGRRVKIEKSGIVFGNLELENLEDEDPQRIGEPRRHRVYESKKILDILYRSIDERSFFQDLHGRRIVSKNDCKTSQGVLTDLWEYILAETTGLAWVHYIEEAATIRETHEAMIFDIILQFSVHPIELLEEIEVLTENTTCCTGYRSRRQNEYLSGMKGKYDHEVISLMNTVHNDEVTGEDMRECVARWLACILVLKSLRSVRRESNGVRKNTFRCWVDGCCGQLAEAGSVLVAEQVLQNSSE